MFSIHFYWFSHSCFCYRFPNLKWTTTKKLDSLTGASTHVESCRSHSPIYISTGEDGKRSHFVFICILSQGSGLGVSLGAHPSFWSQTLSLVLSLIPFWHRFSPHRFASTVVSKVKSTQRNGLSWLEIFSLSTLKLGTPFQTWLTHSYFTSLYLFIHFLRVDLIFSS